MKVSAISSLHRIWPFIVLIFSISPVEAGPSFDCHTASQPDEKAICGSVELSALDQTMSEKFVSARATGDASQIRDLARDFLKQRRNCKADVACIREVLTKEITLFDNQQNRRDEQPAAGNNQPSSSTFSDLKEETPIERCDLAACNQDCIKFYGSAAGGFGDHGPLPVAVCQSKCADQKPFCLAHDGVAIQVPDIAPSSMGKLEFLFCANHKGADICNGER